MTYFQEADIPALLEEIGVDVTFDGTTTKGAVDIADEELLAGEGTHLLGKQSMITIMTGTLPGVKIGSEITVDGDDVKVRDLRQSGDGALTLILLTS